MTQENVFNYTTPTSGIVMKKETSSDSIDVVSADLVLDEAGEVVLVSTVDAYALVSEEDAQTLSQFCFEHSKEDSTSHLVLGLRAKLSDVLEDLVTDTGHPVKGTDKVLHSSDLREFMGKVRQELDKAIKQIDAIEYCDPQEIAKLYEGDRAMLSYMNSFLAA